MLAATRLRFWGKVVVATIVVVGLTGMAAAGRAAPAWFKRAFSPHGDLGVAASAPPVARYRIDNGGVFILDRSSLHPLIKFDDSPEVWALRASRGPRGDIIYDNDLGQPFLRATRLGGMTVFTARRPEGSAAALEGASSPLRLQSVGPSGLYQRLLQDSLRCSRAARHLIYFDAPLADSASDGLIADTAAIATEAMVVLAGRTGGQALLGRVSRIAITQGKHSEVVLRGGVVNITVVPVDGVGGRPSSLRILQAVEAR